jgi:ABC-type transport system involved in multi-copper enzyme maturation permease subunit
MPKFIPIAGITVKEGIRSRLYLVIFFFAVLFLLSSIALSDFTFAERKKILTDLGLTFLILFGLIVSVVLGITLIHRDLDERSIYFILSKPLKRSSYLVGKYLGLLLILVFNLLFMMAIHILLLLLVAKEFEPNLFLAVYPIFLELSLIAAFTIFYASFTTPALVVFFTISTYIIGHSLDILQFTVKKTSGIPHYILKGVTYIFPNLDFLDFKSAIIYHQRVGFEEFLWVTLYVLIYIGALLYFAKVIFEGRELK